MQRCHGVSLTYVNAASAAVHSLCVMARFAITVLLLLVLTLWSLPEFSKWGRHERTSDAIARSKQDCEDQAQKVAATDAKEESFRLHCRSLHSY